MRQRLMQWWSLRKRRARRRWKRFARWFCGRGRVKIWSRRIDSQQRPCLFSRETRAYYPVQVYPDGENVTVQIPCEQHTELRLLLHQGDTHLVGICKPDEVEDALESLVREADKHLKAVRAARKHGWEPEVTG